MTDVEGEPLEHVVPLNTKNTAEKNIKRPLTQRFKIF